MFKSKKHWLIAAGGLLAVSLVATAALVVRGNPFGGGTSQEHAKGASPAAHEGGANGDDDANGGGPAEPRTLRPSGPPESMQFSSSGPVAQTGYSDGSSYGGGSAYNPAASSFPPPGDPPIVRGNDDGSFQPPGSSGTHVSLGDDGPPPVENGSPAQSAGGAGQFDGYPNSDAASSQRFLPPTPAPIVAPGDDASAMHGHSESSPAPIGGTPPSSHTGYEPPAQPEAFGASPNGAAPTTNEAFEGNGPVESGYGPPARFDGGLGDGASGEPRELIEQHAARGAQGAGYGTTGQGAALAYGGAATAGLVTAGGGIGEPGPKQLEGVQSPSLTIEKVAPAEIQVGKQTTFTIKVRNVGQIDAEDVVVYDSPPRGTRYIGSSPEAARAPDGALMWHLGALKPGEESTISLQLVPLQEGQIGSVARVAFAAKASASTICTKPLLTVEHTGPSSVLIGESVNLTIVISNPGTGVATGVTLEEDVPDGLVHPAGNELEYEVGDLRPGESRKLELSLTAEKPGLISNLLLVRGDGNLVAEDRLELEVVAPRLDVALTGPSKRYLERQATYNVRVQNPGTAPAKNIELVAYLPKGLKFISTDNHGQYDAQNHAVYWSLEELPPRMSGDVTVTTLPVETGQQKVRVEGRGDLGLSAAYDQEVQVEGLAELFFQVTDSADPIEVGAETEYEIRVINQGSKTDTNVRVAAQLPVDLQPVGGDGPTRVRVDGQNVIFEPLARLAPKGSAVYKIRVRGARQGDHRIRVQVVSDEVRNPVSKEESTRVYSDQ